MRPNISSDSNLIKCLASRAYQQLYIMDDDNQLTEDKLQQLQVVEESLINLRLQLRATETLRSGILKDIAFHKWSRTKFSRVPREILIMVFLFIPEDQRMRNHRLMLVCKLWRSLVEGTPQLWSRILVKWNGNLDSLGKSWEYIKICHAKSIGISLDTTVDFSQLQAYNKYITALEKRHFSSFNTDPYSLVDREEVYDRGARPKDHTRYLRYESLLENTIHIVHGKNTKYSPMWNSFRVVLPHHWEARDLTLFLNIPRMSESLTKLELIFFLDGFHYDYRGEPVMLPSFRALQIFKSNQNCRIPINSPIVKTLKELTLGNSSATLYFLSNAGPEYSSLEYLSIFTNSYGEPLGLERTVYLPILSTLQVYGNPIGDLLSCFQVPRLCTLYLDTYTPHKCPQAPMFSTIKEIIFNVMDWDGHLTVSEPFFPAFRSLLIGSPKLVSTTIYCGNVFFIVLRYLLTRALGAGADGEIWPELPVKVYLVDMYYEYPKEEIPFVENSII